MTFHRHDSVKPGQHIIVSNEPIRWPFIDQQVHNQPLAPNCGYSKINAFTVSVGFVMLGVFVCFCFTVYAALINLGLK